MAAFMAAACVASACVASASSPSHWINLQAFCERTVACFNGHKALRAAGSVMCAACVWAIQKRAAIGDAELQHAWVSHVQMCIFSSQLANICSWVGMPTVPYWLPAVTQEDRKMEDREQEGGGEIKGVVMMWGHEPRGFLSLLFLICLSDDNKKHGSMKEERSASEKKGRKQCWRKRKRERASGIWREMTNRFSCLWQNY